MSTTKDIDTKHASGSNLEVPDDPPPYYVSEGEPDVDDIPAEDSTFSPNKIYYIHPHNLFSKEVVISDITGQVPMFYTAGDIADEYQESAKEIGEDAGPTFTIDKKHRFTHHFTLKEGTDGKELVYWKHPLLAISSATISFPADSPHGSHELTLEAPWVTSRTNQWIQDNNSYEWKCDSKLKSNKMTLTKPRDGKKGIIGKYAQKLIAFRDGGVLLVDEREIDGPVAIVTACLMLRRKQQRAAQRSNAGGGADGG